MRLAKSETGIDHDHPSQPERTRVAENRDMFSGIKLATPHREFPFRPDQRRPLIFLHLHQSMDDRVRFRITPKNQVGRLHV